MPGGGEALAGRFPRHAAPATVELWEVPGSRHTAGLTTARDEWIARVTGFLDRSVHGREPRDRRAT